MHQQPEKARERILELIDGIESLFPGESAKLKAKSTELREIAEELVVATAAKQSSLLGIGVLITLLAGLLSYCGATVGAKTPVKLEKLEIYSTLIADTIAVTGGQDWEKHTANYFRTDLIAEGASRTFLRKFDSALVLWQLAENHGMGGSHDYLEKDTLKKAWKELPMKLRERYGEASVPGKAGAVAATISEVEDTLAGHLGKNWIDELDTTWTKDVGTDQRRALLAVINAFRAQLWERARNEVN